MTVTPEQINVEATAVNGTINTFLKWLVDLGVKLAQGKLPFLNIWPLNKLVPWLAQKAAAALIGRVSKQYITEVIITNQNRKKVNHAIEARDELREAINAKDPERIKKASEAFDEKYSKLVRYGGHANNAN